MPLPIERERYTYADYCTWDDDFRCELIDGEIYVDGQLYPGKPGAAVMMAPAPALGHQSISVDLTRQLANFLKGKPCKVFHAPFDVRLNAGTGDDTVVQPDIAVVCDMSKLSEKGCVGAPDLVIEILSPSSARRDRFLKLNAYQRAGVREYWIVDPDTKTVLVNILENGKYFIKSFSDADTAPVHVLEGCTIGLRDVFAAVADFDT